MVIYGWFINIMFLTDIIAFSCLEILLCYLCTRQEGCEAVLHRHNVQSIVDRAKGLGSEGSTLEYDARMQGYFDYQICLEAL